MHVIETKIVNSFLGGQGRKKGGKLNEAFIQNMLKTNEMLS